MQLNQSKVNFEYYIPYKRYSFIRKKNELFRLELTHVQTISLKQLAKGCEAVHFYLLLFSRSLEYYLLTAPPPFYFKC